MKILLVSHKGLATGMLTAAKFVAGDVAKADVIEMGDGGLSGFRAELNQLLETYTPQEKVMLVSDIPAGSGGSTAYVELKQRGFDVTYVSGMNLAFLLEYMLSGNLEQALKGGHDALHVITDEDDADDDEEDF